MNADLADALNAELAKERKKSIALQEELGLLRIELFATQPSTSDDTVNLKRQIASSSSKLTRLRMEIEDKDDELEVLREEVHALRQRLVSEESSRDVNDQLLELELMIEKLTVEHDKKYGRLKSKYKRLLDRYGLKDEGFE
jgi:chromosome segregation ATPase